VLLSPSFGQGQLLSAFSPGGTFSCIGLLASFATNQTWTVANVASYIPVRVTHPVMARKLVWKVGSNTPAGNYDVGLYDATGLRLASSGSTAMPAANTVVSYDMGDLWLEQQIVYFALVLSSGASGFFYGYLVSALHGMRACGLVKQAAALPLPATATFEAITATVLMPLHAIQTRTQAV